MLFAPLGKHTACAQIDVRNSTILLGRLPDRAHGTQVFELSFLGMGFRGAVSARTKPRAEPSGIPF